MLQFYFNNHIWVIQSLELFENYFRPESIHHWKPGIHGNHWTWVLLLDPNLIIIIKYFSSLKQPVKTFMELNATATCVHTASGICFLKIVYISINFISVTAFMIIILIAAVGNRVTCIRVPTI